MAFSVFLPFIFPPEQYGMAVIWLLVILSCSSVLGAAGVSPWYSWMADIIPERERGRFWGMRGMIVNSALIVFMPVFGWLFKVYSSGGSFKDSRSSSPRRPG